MTAARSCGAAPDGGHIEQPGNLGDRIPYRGCEGRVQVPARLVRVRLDTGRENTVAGGSEATATAQPRSPLAQPHGRELREPDQPRSPFRTRSTRRRFTPKSKRPHREADWTWTTCSPAEYRNSRSSRNLRKRVRQTACRWLSVAVSIRVRGMAATAFLSRRSVVAGSPDTGNGFTRWIRHSPGQLLARFRKKRRTDRPAGPA